MNLRTYPLFTLLATLVFAAQAGRAEELAQADLEFFEKEVRPLLIKHCYDCHSAESDISGGLGLDSRHAILAGGDTGPALVPGEPEKSLRSEEHTSELQSL